MFTSRVLLGDNASLLDDKRPSEHFPPAASKGSLDREIDNTRCRSLASASSVIASHRPTYNGRLTSDTDSSTPAR